MNLQLPFHLGLVFLFFQLWIYPRNVVDMVQAQNKLEFPRIFQGGFPEPILPQLKDPFHPFQRHSSPTQLTWSLCWVASKGFGHRRQSSQKQTWLVSLVVVVVVVFLWWGGGIKVKVYAGACRPKMAFVLFFFPMILLNHCCSWLWSYLSCHLTKKHKLHSLFLVRPNCGPSEM